MILLEILARPLLIRASPRRAAPGMSLAQMVASSVGSRRPDGAIRRRPWLVVAWLSRRTVRWALPVAWRFFASARTVICPELSGQLIYG